MPSETTLAWHCGLDQERAELVREHVEYCAKRFRSIGNGVINVLPVLGAIAGVSFAENPVVGALSGFGIGIVARSFLGAIIYTSSTRQSRNSTLNKIPYEMKSLI
ncbi:MAG: hypothetical protein HYW25_04830 [Candidatus Aenigmarchaeota archaeon]|nr:hypothetical protein [Candidatus Aenigmarchaeota archaeon]